MIIDQDDYNRIEQYLFQKLPMYQNQGAKAYKKDLSNIVKLCQRLGDPHKDLKCIHIAGTNGKGSTTNYIASMLIEMGYRVGVYTSPHLIDYRERIKIGSEYITKSFVVEFVNQNREIIDEISPSFFELTLAMAFCYFRDMEVDYVCLEVGLGGRLDSTNIVTPILSIITNVSYDHMAILGDNLSAIAYEKAGIIKPNIPVLIGEKQSEEISEVYDTIALKHSAPIIYAEDLVQIARTQNHLEISITTSDRVVLDSNLFEAHYQSKNVVTASAALKYLSVNQCIKHDREVTYYIQQGLVNYFQNTRFMGRWMPHPYIHRVYFECAHNQAGIEQLIHTLSHYEYQKLRIVFGMVKDKDISNVVKHLPRDADYYVTQAKVPRSMNCQDLEAMLVAQSLNVKRSDSNPCMIYRQALSLHTSDDLLIVTGSIFLVGDILSSIYEG